MTGHYVVEQAGGPEALQWVSTVADALQPNQVRIAHTAIGLNYIDVYHRSGVYPLPMPSRLGVEAAGKVVETGSAVTRVSEGDRAAYALAMGAYGTTNVVPESVVVRLPDTITDEIAAGCLLKGLTASYLLRKTFSVSAGDTILVHAAAGGVGLILCQWAKHLGARVIGTVGNKAKAALVKENGADHTIEYDTEDVVQRVRALTDNSGVPVVYDSVGAATYQRSLDCLAPLGMLVSYGNASGKVDRVDPQDLANRGSLFFTRPSLAAYAHPVSALDDLAASLFQVIATGAVTVHVKQRYALSDLPQAHTDLEARLTTGSTVLLPSFPSS